jgi:two-component system, OmpR family, response regulator TctD
VLDVKIDMAYIIAMRILLVEDNEVLAEAVISRFRSEGQAIDHESNGSVANSLLKREQFDLILLDINLPGENGYEILQNLRARGDKTPVLMLTAKAEIDDRITGLDFGADDYMVKPFDFRELSARCRALGRRKAGYAKNEFSAGNLYFDIAAKQASVNGVNLELRHREIQLLETFLNNLDRVLTKEQLVDKIYTFNEAPTLNAIEQTLARLRKKLEGSPLIIKTARGLGYIAHVIDDN